MDLFSKLARYAKFVVDFFCFKGRSSKRLNVTWKDRWVCLDDVTSHTSFDRHYVYHTSWAARHLARLMPECHIDISSDLRFVTLVSAFVPIHFYDYRPAELVLSGLETRSADITALPFADGSISSLSSMHVVEHVGLGRYGDPIDPDGDLKSIAELIRVLAPGGDLFFVVPIGKPLVMFNAHRVYSYDQIIRYFSSLTLMEFCLIPDQSSSGGLLTDPPTCLVEEQRYGCGCFWFRKGN